MTLILLAIFSALLVSLVTNIFFLASYRYILALRTSRNMLLRFYLIEFIKFFFVVGGLLIIIRWFESPFLKITCLLTYLLLQIIIFLLYPYILKYFKK